VDRVAQKHSYKQAALEQLKGARIANAMAAMTETDAANIAAHTQKDKELESVIVQLEKENSGIQQFAIAYEKENKIIIENNELANVKVQSQAELSTNYLSVLEKLENEKQKELDLSTDNNKANEIRMELGEIKTEKARVSTKLNEYNKQNNVAVASSTSATAANGAAKNPHLSLEDELELEGEKLSSHRTNVAHDASAKTEADVAKDALQTEKMFKPRTEVESIFAYESGIFEEIVFKHKGTDNELKNREKIAELNNQIFLIEGEMENVTSDSKLRKLDYQAEQMYLKRSLIEIDNSPAIARMAAMEYENESAKAKELTQSNREKINGSYIIKEEIAKLERQKLQSLKDKRLPTWKRLQSCAKNHLPSTMILNAQIAIVKLLRRKLWL